MARREKEKIKNNLILKIIIVAILLIIAIVVIKLASNYKKDDIVGRINLIINNSNVTSSLKEDVFVDKNGIIYISKGDIENFFDNYVYYDEKYNQIITGSNNKIANIVVGENVATINNSTVKIGSSVIKKDDKYFIPFSELKDVYNIKVEYKNNRVIVDSLDKKYQIATITKDINVKYKPTVLSRNVDKIKAGDTVTISNRNDDIAKDGWKKIRTSNGILGYIEEKNLGKFNTLRENMVEKAKVDGKVSLVWDYFYEYTNAPNRSGKLKGVNVVSPTFFTLEKLGKGSVHSNVGTSGENYINWAHNNDLKVWAMISNNSMPETTSEIMNDYKLRNKLINNIVDLVVKYNLDGINIDFENMYAKDKNLFSRFLIELEPRLNEIGKCLSVDVTAPDGSEMWSMCFDRYTIAKVADYIVFMAYDQHGTSGDKEGTTAGCNWVEANVTKFLGQEGVDSSKLVLGMPFYTRLWKEVDGKLVTSATEVVDMKNIDSKIPKGIEKKWDDNLKQYYVEFNQNGATYKMWIEDEKSIEAKLALIDKYKLAGASYWEKDRENSNIWDLIANKLGN